MANLEDVIELGSSDEEKGPAPKKKRQLNIMVKNIPKKLPGITIKPATASKPKINPISIARGNIGKSVTVTKVTSGGSKLANPFANKNKANGNPIILRKQNVAPNPPISHTLKLIPTIKKLHKIPLKIAKGIATAPKLVSSLPTGILPPGITVKRTSQLQPALKQNMKPNPVNVQIKRKVNNTSHRKASDMVFVDLDDDDTQTAPAAPAGPQWYLRPEEQEAKTDISNKSDEKSNVEENEKSDSNQAEKAIAVKDASVLEEQNNKEPETANFIEITIEDSPAKPQPKAKRTFEVSEQAITIDDSPVKVLDKQVPLSGSDEETTTPTEKHSKKKLEYQKTNQPETVEIEIEFTSPNKDSTQNDDKTNSQDAETEIVDIVNSPIKPAASFLMSTPKKKLQQKPDKQKPKLKLDESRMENDSKVQLMSKTSPGEFHPVYQSFIDLCFRLENSDDMSKIIEKKIKAYYRQVPKAYTESEMFTDMVASKISAMKAGPEKMYLYIKDVVDELNLQRKIAKSQSVNVVTVNEEQEKFLYGEDSEFDLKRQRQIRKLEKTLKKLHRAIQKLEEQEVDFDDEEDSVYLLTESEKEIYEDNQAVKKSELLKRYKERMIRVHAKFCQLTNTKMPSEPRVQMDARPGQPKGPAKRLEKWINKKVPIGTPLPFPDFHDVLRCVRDANQEDKLGWNEVDIMGEARDLFTRCGKKLQRRRQENEWRLAASRIQSELDPAENSEALKKALESNRREASKRENDVLNKYADRQNQLNLEAVEIGDKEADESPVETDDEEPTEESTSLHTKEKRKERLKRLLQEKSKKDNDEKQQSDLETNENDTSRTERAKTNSKEDSKGERKSENKNVDKNSHAHKKNDLDKNSLSDKENDNKKDPVADSENVHTLSEDSSKIDSDIDELYLLQKLHSNVVDSSTLESSDSESAIAISDSLSSGDNRKQASDVISIENSSYSESEKNNEQEYEIVSYSRNKNVTESVNVQIEIECSDTGFEKIINKSNNDEYNESVEDILLASSDDEASNNKNAKSGSISTDNENVTKSKYQTTNAKETEMVKEKANNTDASSIESITFTVAQSSEVTSINNGTGNGGMLSNAAEVSGINSVKIVEADDTPKLVEAMTQNNTALTSPKSSVSVKDTINKKAENEDVTMTSLTENDKTSDKINNTNSQTDKLEAKEDSGNQEVTSSTLMEIQDNVTDKPSAETINDKEHKGLCTKYVTEVNNKGLEEKASNDLPISEPMEVDDNKT